MADQARDVQRKIKILRHVEQSGCVAKTCRYFGIGRASFYRWRTAYRQLGEAGLVNAKPIPKNPVNRTSPATPQFSGNAYRTPKVCLSGQTHRPRL